MSFSKLDELARQSWARQLLQADASRTDALLIYNPSAGPHAELQRDLEQVVKYLGERGWHVTLRTTRKPGDATELARAAVAARCRVVFTAGGDGTIHEVVNGLVGSNTALGVLPVGTGNVWAKEIGLPTLTLLAQRDRLLAAARMLVDGQMRQVDVGRAGEHYFLVGAGVGFDSTVTAQIEPRTRATKQLGGLAYLSVGLWIARDFGGVRSTIVIDDHTIRTKIILIVVTNIQLYSGMFKMTPEARLDDGLLDIRIFKGLGPVWVLRHMAGVFTNRHLHDPTVLHFQGRQVAIHTAEPFPLQLDGEHMGMTPTVIEVVPKALRVLVPQAASDDLFVDDGYALLPSLPPRSRRQRVYEMGARLRNLAQSATHLRT